jgi:hypothetical protein
MFPSGVFSDILAESKYRLISIESLDVVSEAFERTRINPNVS